LFRPRPDSANDRARRAALDGGSVAWLSNDQRDDDPATIWTYVVAALQTAVPEVGGDTLALLQSAQSLIDAVLASLLNDLDAVPPGVVLVLDDYHVIDARDVQHGVAFASASPRYCSVTRRSSCSTNRQTESTPMASSGCRHLMRRMAAQGGTVSCRATS